MSWKSALRPALVATNRRLRQWGIDGKTTLAAARGYTAVRSDRKRFDAQRRNSDHPEEFPLGQAFAVYADREDAAGTASGHYFHQDLFVAREIFHRQPQRHVDVGSSVYGFVSHVASFRNIDVFDVRPLTVRVQGITFIQHDLMKPDEQFDAMTDSLSCLHALEHFGLGRYSDPIDYDGWRKGFANLTRMLKPGGTLYFSVPTGQVQRVEFNGQRVFSLPFLRDFLTQEFTVEKLAFVTDDGDLVDEVDPFGDQAQTSFGAHYGCSIWLLAKNP